MAPLDDRARALQRALAQGSWDEGFELIAEALREERQEAFKTAIQALEEYSANLRICAETIIRDWTGSDISESDRRDNYRDAREHREMAKMVDSCIGVLTEAGEHLEPEQDDSGMPTAEDARGILK